MVELSAGASVALGVIVGLVSTSVQSVGLTLQRKSHLLEEEKEEDYERRPPYKRRRWQLGMLMFIVANLVGSTIQITTLPLPVLSTLQASGLVFNSICASILLSEPFTRHSFVGTVLVAAGALLIGIFGAITEPSHNLDQLLGLLGRKQFIMWMFATLVIVLGLVIANWLLKRIYPRTTPRLRLVRGMFFGCISGILSAHSLLIAKSAVELLVRTIVDRHNQFDRWQSWMILLGLVAFALTQLYYMHRGLKLCSTSVLYPLVFCVYNIIAIIDGLIYFDQSARLTSLHAGLVALGTAILLTGVVSLSWRLEEQDEEPQSPTKHKGNVPLPQPILTPGIGLIQGTMDDEPESPVDLEEQAPGVHGSLAEQRKRRRLDERAPLLARTPTGPALTVTTQPKKRLSLNTNQRSSQQISPSPRPPPGRRRRTISEETSEIWNELNDRDSLLSPARRSAELGRRPRSGTLPPRRNNNSGTWLNQMRRRSWFDSLGGSGRKGSVAQGKRPVNSSSSLLDHPDPDDDDDNDNDNQSDPDAVMTSLQRRRGTWGFSDREGRGNEDGLGDWFKLKWWRKKWKDEEDEQRGRDDER
ncbi:magnesium transporter NIPA-domain-containing protein [Massariosphaeria phaeospora]|uniref:Magnesium transporter NIPA-domain-containing protein n=1 Tax=Massariosphaeria phaeospora TaxID=100035 RepID=A0A7C8M7P2_9PLEO|nr:magnesium transporter NIPA-domain-containing protein [Massariosphaeria phaeospora]